MAIPTELLRQLKVKPGDRLEWTVQGNELVVRPVRSLDSVRGRLASKVPFPGLEGEKAAIRTRPSKPSPTSGQPGESQAVAFDGNAWSRVSNPWRATSAVDSKWSFAGAP